MSKKAKRTPKSADLIEARVVREEEWALEAWRARVPYPEMRRLAALPPDAGGLGYVLNESALRGLVQSARSRHGETVMTRADRIDRQQAEIDERIRRASFDLRKWHAFAQRPAPDRAEFEGAEHPDIAWRTALEAHGKMIAEAMKAVAEADRRLAAAMKDERELHGDNAATKIEAEVTTRDAVTEELNAMLIRAGRTPVESE